jgi:hypothetical protein
MKYFVKEEISVLIAVLRFIEWLLQEDLVKTSNKTKLVA